MAEPTTPTPMSEKLTDKIWELNDEIKRLKAALVTARADEREACAELADAHASGAMAYAPEGQDKLIADHSRMIAAAIRSRS